MNSINIKGNLVADAEVKETSKGKIVTFVVGDNYRSRTTGENTVQYLNCAVRNEKAMAAAEALKKGDYVNDDGVLKVTSTKNEDGTYFNNTTLWLNRFNPKPEKKDDAPAEA